MEFVKSPARFHSLGVPPLLAARRALKTRIGSSPREPMFFTPISRRADAIPGKMSRILRVQTLLAATPR